MSAMTADQVRMWADIPESERVTRAVAHAFVTAPGAPPWVKNYGYDLAMRHLLAPNNRADRPQRCPAAREHESLPGFYRPCGSITYRSSELCPFHGGTPNPYKARQREQMAAQRDRERRRRRPIAVPAVRPSEFLGLTVRQFKALALVADALSTDHP